MARILLIICLLFFKFATLSIAGSDEPMDVHVHGIIEGVGQDITALLASQDKFPGKTLASHAPISHLKKKKGLRVRYMKPEIRYAVSCYIALVVRPFFSDKVFVNSYSCHFCSEHYQLSKLRGPPSL